MLRSGFPEGCAQPGFSDNNADAAPAKPSITILDEDAAGHYLPRLTPAKGARSSALDEPPRFAQSGNITPANYFGDGKFYAVNTMQPAYQPSGNPPAAGDSDFLYADPNNATTLPPQTQATIGDMLDAKQVGWIWYSGAWDTALADGRRPPLESREAIYAPETPAGSPDFQPHHQPFNYYADFDPATEKFTEYSLPEYTFPYRANFDKNGDIWASTMSTDRVVRLDPRTGQTVQYLMPSDTNMRTVFVDNSTTPVTFWVGSNHDHRIVKVEPLD